MITIILFHEMSTNREQLELPLLNGHARDNYFIAYFKTAGRVQGQIMK